MRTRFFTLPVESATWGGAVVMLKVWGIGCVPDPETWAIDVFTPLNSFKFCWTGPVVWRGKKIQAQNRDFPSLGHERLSNLVASK